MSGRFYPSACRCLASAMARSSSLGWRAGRIEAAENGSEYGKVEVSARAGSLLFQDVPACSQCWMSHTDYIKTLPSGYRISADTGICPVAAMENAEKKIYAVQFHPEVTHTAFGKQMLHNFLYEICGCKGDWRMDDFVERSIERYREALKGKKVLCALSGGVDSSVAAVLLHKAIGKNLTCSIRRPRPAPQGGRGRCRAGCSASSSI